MGKAKILVADDEYVMREGIKETLLDMGYRVDLAKDGDEAIRLLRTNLYSMVITDIKMPKAGGMDVLMNARQTSPDIPVLMMTAYGTVDNAVEAMKNGAFDYILKPFSAEAVEKCVLRALGGNNQSHAGAAEAGSLNRTIITRDKDMLKLLELAENVAKSDATVLIQGESGTGKELLARLIHSKSPRRKAPFVAVNCAALPENLLESELFGHEKGAFTGAIGKKIGKFEQAEGGTLLLDEVSEMNLVLQAKLLRVLQERVVDRVGGIKPVDVDIRIIATTNRDMREVVSDGSFREDLYYRINVFPLNVPPLRERVVDIPLLSEYFVKKYSREEVVFSPDALMMLEKSPWQGNIRELENIIQRALLVAGKGPILQSHLFFNERPAPHAPVDEKTFGLTVGMSVRDAERELIIKTLDKYEGNRSKAAEVLDISVRTLRNKLKEYKLCHD